MKNVHSLSLNEILSSSRTQLALSKSAICLHQTQYPICGFRQINAGLLLQLGARKSTSYQASSEFTPIQLKQKPVPETSQRPFNTAPGRLGPAWLAAARKAPRSTRPSRKVPEVAIFRPNSRRSPSTLLYETFPDRDRRNTPSFEEVRHASLLALFGRSSSERIYRMCSSIEHNCATIFLSESPM